MSRGLFVQVFGDIRITVSRRILLERGHIAFTFGWCAERAPPHLEQLKAAGGDLLIKEGIPDIAEPAAALFDWKKKGFVRGRNIRIDRFVA